MMNLESPLVEKGQWPCCGGPWIYDRHKRRERSWNQSWFQPTRLWCWRKCFCLQIFGKEHRLACLGNEHVPYERLTDRSQRWSWRSKLFGTSPNNILHNWSWATGTRKTKRCPRAWWKCAPRNNMLLRKSLVNNREGEASYSIPQSVL